MGGRARETHEGSPETGEKGVDSGATAACGLRGTKQGPTVNGYTLTLKNKVVFRL